MEKITNDSLFQIMHLKEKALESINQSGLPEDICSILKKDLRYSIQMKTKRVPAGKRVPIGQTKIWWSATFAGSYKMAQVLRGIYTLSLPNPIKRNRALGF